MQLVAQDYFLSLGAQFYGTYPGAYAQQMQQANYPHGAPQQHDPTKPYGF
jgi:hypothetical protein